MIEYDSDNYSLEKVKGNFSPRSQINYGLTYDVSDATQVGLDWLYGTSLGGSVFLRLDPVHSQYPQKIEPAPPPVEVRSAEQQRRALATLEGLRDPRNATKHSRTAAPSATALSTLCGGRAVTMPTSSSTRMRWTWL